MAQSKSSAQKTCFVVSQIGHEESEARIQADWVFDGILTPLFREDFKDFCLIRADRINSPGLIDAQVIDNILNSDLVIADLTGLNTNVFYEIGIRHTVAKPIIHIHEVGENIPFDVSLFRSVKYSVKRHSDVERAKADIKESIKLAISPDHRVENPVTQTRGRIELREDATPRERVIESQIEYLTKRISILENGLNEDQNRSNIDIYRGVDRIRINVSNSVYSSVERFLETILITDFAHIILGYEPVSEKIAWLKISKNASAAEMRNLIEYLFEESVVFATRKRAGFPGSIKM